MAARDRSGLIEHYERFYQTTDAFGHDNTRYRSFIRALVQKTGLGPGASALDAGCGQGYLSKYLADCGLKVWCADLSPVGLRSLERYGNAFRGRRVVADVLRPPFRATFDLVFQRSCSVLNTPDETMCATVVERLTDCAKVGGLICIVYNSNLRGTGDVWFNHTPETFWSALKSDRLIEPQVFVLNKVECEALGLWGFNGPVTWVNTALSRLTQRSFEIVAMARRRQ
jgi:SAM-dependent methyltransferase